MGTERQDGLVGQVGGSDVLEMEEEKGPHLGRGWFAELKMGVLLESIIAAERNGLGGFRRIIEARVISICGVGQNRS